MGERGKGQLVAKPGPTPPLPHAKNLHGVHSAAPELEKRPLVQAVQFTRPTTSLEYVPPTQLSHVVAAIRERFPASHEVHEVAPVPE